MDLSENVVWPLYALDLGGDIRPVVRKPLFLIMQHLNTCSTNSSADW
jgi:hypothetical protein